MEKIVIPALNVSFALTDWVVKGLENGTFERVGGVIREVATKKVVGWLREISSTNPYQKFTEIENQLGAVQNGLKLTQGMLQLSTAASLLSLGVSVMGFAVITQRLNDARATPSRNTSFIRKN